LNIKENLIYRKVNLDLHKPIISYTEQVATFFCWNLSGQMVGYQSYRLHGDKKIFNNPRLGRYYTYRSKIPSVFFWGLESFYSSDGPIFITEGIFDACRMTFRNRTAFAALCNDPPKDFKNWLKCLNRPTVAICDNDAAGIKLAKVADHFEVVPKGDLGDSSEEYVTYLIERYDHMSNL
jgi:hypothetical protein